MPPDPAPGGWRRRFRLEAGARRVERDVDDEIEFHLAMRTQKLIARGFEPAAARAQALQQFGDLAAVRSECLTITHDRERAVQRASYLKDLGRDAAYALRSLRQRKGFTAVMLLILALGIGANTAMFTLVDALLLRALPVPHPEQLVTVFNPRRTNGRSTGDPSTELASVPLYLDLRDQARTVTGLFASGHTARLDVLVGGGGGEPEHPVGRFVSGSYFAVLQVPAYAGRTFAAEDDRSPGGHPVVVISHAYWRRRFGGEHSAIGRALSVNGVPLTIIGVAPPGFFGDVVGQRTDLWIPLMMQPSLMPHIPWLDNRGASWLLLMGRLAPGASLVQARAELSALARRSLLEHATPAQVGSVERQLRTNPVMVGPGARGFSYYRSVYARPLVTLMTAVALVLLVVCANVANLMLARAAAREREVGVRLALGASRARLVRQFLTESALLALAGSALGLLIAVWGSAALLRLAGGGPQPIPLDARLDGRVLGFTAAVAIVTAVLFGLVPALRATRLDLASALRAQGRGVAGAALGRGRFALGKLLVVAQVALSMLLLVSTGMLVRSTRRLETADLGLARDRLVLTTVDPARSGYAGPRLLALMRDLTERVRRLPGVADVSVSENGIFSGTESGTTLQVEGYTARADSDTVVASDAVGPAYFRTIGARLLQGRDFESRDNESAPKVAILNETMARFFFPAGGALGHHVVVDSAAREIVGVVADVEEQGVREPPTRRLYMPIAQLSRPLDYFRLVIRAAGGGPLGSTAPLVASVPRAVRAADPSLAGVRITPLDDLVRNSITQDRLVARVVTAFGVLALILAALGLYGVMAYAAVRRTSEFGLRMALGAEPGDVTRLVLREALALVAGGVALGLPAALAATRLLRGQLFGVGLLDLPSIALAVVVLGASAAAAGFLPARRAARVPPLLALRAD